MLSRISSSAENCTQSSGVAGGMPVNSTMRAGTSNVGTASAKFETMPIHTTRLNQVPAIARSCNLEFGMQNLECQHSKFQIPNSEFLQVLHHCPLVTIGQSRSVNMAAVAVAGH